jgi:hypothetical protein
MAFICVAAYYFWRDLNLPMRIGLKNLPDIVVENLDFRRTVGSRDVRLQAYAAEHESGFIRATDITISVKELNSGRETSMRAEKCEFSEDDSSAVEIKSLDGYVFLGDRSVDVSAPSASYERSSDVWRFEEGLDLSDDDISITGGTGAITSAGVVSLEKGVIVRWRVE